MKLKYIKEIDVFGPKIELRLGDKKTHKTLCGATMTLFVVACSITAVILIGKELIQKDSPSVSFQQILADESNSQTSSNISSFGSFSQISLSDIQLMVGITDQQGQDIPKDIIDKLQIQIHFIQKDGNNYQKTLIQTEQCKGDSFQNYNLSDFNPSNYLCLSDKQQFDAWGYDTDFKAQYFEVSVQCKTAQCLQSCCQYQKLKLNLLYQDQYFSPNKYTQCYSPIYNSKYIDFNLLSNGVDGSQDYDLILQKSTVVTDQGWLTSIFDKTNYVIINELAQSLNSNVDFVLSLRISVHPLRLIYQRSYLKVQGLLAVVGGLLKTLILIGRVLVKPIAKLSMNSELVNELFVFEDQRNRRLRQSMEKQMQSSISDSDSSEIYKKEENKFKKQYVLKELDQQNFNQESEVNQELYSNQLIYGQNMQPKQLDKKILQQDNFSYQNELMLKKQCQHLTDYQMNNQQKSNNYLFKNDYIDQLKGINQIKQRESIIDSKNVSSIQQAKLNLKNSMMKRDYNPQQNFSTQNQILQKYGQNYQITINDSDKKKKYSALNTPKSKFLQENLANLQAQQNKFESSAFKRVRTRSNSQISKKQQEINIVQEQKQKEQEEKGELNINFIDQQNTDNKQVNLQEESENNQKELNLEASNEENRVFNARRANKYLTAEVSQNQYNSIKVDDSLKVFQSVKQNVNAIKQQDNSNQKQLAKPNIQNKPNLFKRKGTTIITEILQKNYLVQRGMRKTTVKEQNEDNARFSNELENMQEKPLRFTCLDYIKYYFSQLKCLSKKKQIKYSVKKVTERFDIIYILQKLVEIDKLKVLLLSYEQQKLFEYMPKPVVQTDPEKQENNLMLGRMNADLQQNWTLLNSEKGNLDKFTEAFHAYKQIQMKQEKEPLDERLIMMLDPDVKRYFDITKADGSQVVTPNNNSRKVSMIPLKFNVPDQGQGLKQSIMLARSQMQQIKLQQQKDEVRMRLTSSYIEKNDYGQDNQQKQEDHQIIDLQQSNRLNNFYEKEENKNIKNRLSQKYNGNIQFQPLLAPSGDVNSPKSTQQFIQSQTMFSQQPSIHIKNNEQRINHQSSSGEQIEENIQGKTSYPRESICLNQVDFMENNNQYSKLSTLSLKDNQFSFARKSIESPLFLFDPQKKQLIKLSSIKNTLLPVSQISQSNIKSFETINSQKEENQENLNKNEVLEYQQFYKISPYSFLYNRKSQSQKKRRCQSQHDLENISEQQENEYQNQLFVQLGNPKNISFGNQTLINSNDNTNDKHDQSLKRLIVLTNSDETQANEMAHFDDKKLKEQLLISYQANQEHQKERKDKNFSQDYNSEQNIINNKFRKNSENSYNITPPLQAHRQNSPNMSYLFPKHRKNTNSVGSQTSLSKIKKDSINLNGSNSQALKDSPMLDFDNNFLSLHHPRLFFVNPFNRNITSQQTDQDKEINPFKRESVKNNEFNKINSYQSFQSIPEEYLKSKRGDFNFFNNINNGKYEEDNNFNNQQKAVNLDQQEIQECSKKENNNFVTKPFECQLQNNNYFKTAYSQTEQNAPHNVRNEFSNKYQNNNYFDDQQNHQNRVSEPSKQQYSHQKNKYSTPSQNVSPFKNQKMQDLFQPFSYNSSQHDQQLNIQQTTSINSIQSNFKQIKNSINSHQKEINCNQQNQQDNNSQDNIQFFKDLIQKDKNIQNKHRLQSTQITNNELNYKQTNDQNVQCIEMTPQKQIQDDEISLQSYEQPVLNQQKSYRYSSINFNIPQQIISQQRINVEKPQNVDKNVQLSANKSIKQRVSLNPQLISSQNQNGLNSSQVQNFLKQNNNAKLYESPYTQQQRFLKKRQQEKIEQQLRESQYSQQIQQINNSIFQNYHNEAQDFNKNPRNQNSQSHKSNKSQEKFDIPKRVTINDPKNYNQASTNRQIARSPSIQQDALLTTENDENKDFIPRNEQQQCSQNYQMQTEENEDLIQFNRTSRDDSINSCSETKEKSQKQNTELLQTEDIIVFDEKDTDTNHHSQI